MISHQKSKSSTKQGLNVAFRGDKQIIPLLNLKLQFTIVVQKPFVTLIPIVPVFDNQDKNPQNILEPILGIQVFGQPQKEVIIKNKNLLKDNVLYIYFPSNIRVDEKVNKIFMNTYESIIKEIPRNMRNNFVKLILYQQSTSVENSIQGQKNKCSDVLGQLFKINLQKKIQGLYSQINAISYNELNLKNLMVLFKNKMALAQIFRRIGLDQKSEEMLELVWQDMLYNQKFFGQSPLYLKEIQYLPPYVERSYHQIVREFSNPQNFLKICSFAFFKCFEMQLELMSYCQAMRSLKKFIEFCYGNVFAGIKNRSQLFKNIWVLSIVDESYSIAQRLGRTYPTFLNPQRESEYHSLAVYIAKSYRNSIQQMGAIFYAFNHLNSFPRTLQVEVDQSLIHLEKINNKVISQAIEDSKIIAEKVEENLLLLFGGIQTFKILYLKSLINLYELLNKSANHKRNARAVKLIILKMFLTTTQPPNLQFSQPYLSKYSSKTADVYGYIDKILSKAQKYTMLDEQQGFINDTVFKRSLRYSIDKDNYINRNKEDQNLWPQLKFLEDYYKFIILLISYRKQGLLDKNKEESSFHLSFSKSEHRIPIKSDNIIHLLLNKDLMNLQSKWEITCNLVRQIFLLQKGEEDSLQSNNLVTIRMGILLDARIAQNADSDQTLIIKVNNQQLYNLNHLSEHSLIELSMEIIDANKVVKVVQLKLMSIQVGQDQAMELEFSISHRECLIFIIRELRVKIGLLQCYYVNKSLEIEQIKALEEQQRINKKRGRKYSSFQQKLKEEEFIHMVNKSDHLALDHLRYHTLVLRPKYAVNVSPKYDMRDSSSQSSLYNLIKDRPITIPLYVDLWTPVFYTIKPNPQSNVKTISLLPQHIQILSSQKEQISDWVKLNSIWVNRCNEQTINIELGEQGLEVMLMVRCRNIKQIRAAKKHRKDSEMSRSVFSSNASWQKGQFFRLQIQLLQDQYTYSLQSNICYNTHLPFDIKYMYCEDLQQYSLQNIAKVSINVYESSASEPYSLSNMEEIRLGQPHIEAQVILCLDDQQRQKQFRSSINLQNYIKRELLRPQKLQTCELKIYNSHQSFKRFQVIKIISSESGVLSILDAGSGFELIGKIEGEIRRNGQGIIDMYLLPMKIGRLILPSLLIGEKKGVWKDQIFLNIVQ